MLWRAALLALLAACAACAAARDPADGAPPGGFDLLSDVEKRALWSADDGSSVREKLEALDEFEVDSLVEVRLVGFPEVDRDELLRALELLRLRDHAVQVVHDGGGSNNHRLAVKQDVVFRVVHSRRSLAEAVSAAVERQAVGKGRRRVPVADVDELIRADYAATALSYALYVLGPEAAPGQYLYVDAAHEESCAVRHWVGQQRYAWVDLSAADVELSHALAGAGVVNGASFPRRGEPGFVPKLATFAHAAAAALVIPPLRFVPEVTFSTDIHVLVNVLYDAKTRPEVPDLGPVLEELAVGGQRVSVGVEYHSFSGCSACVSAFASSLRAHGASQQHEFLDSEALHEWLGTAFKYRFATYDAAGGAGGRFVPVYLFALKTTAPLQLDRAHQVVAYPDMVLAVQTRAYDSVTGFTCNGGVPVAQRHADIERELLAGVLQTGWGVLSTAESWDPLEHATALDFTWAVGDTPFGPYSTSARLSFVQRDAAARNHLLARMDHAIREVRTALQHFADYGLEPRELLAPASHLEFVRRWNFFRHQLDRAGSFLALHSFSMSDQYLTALMEDVAALHEMVHEAGGEVRTVVSCAAEAAAADAGGEASSWALPFMPLLWGVGCVLGPAHAWRRWAGKGRRKARRFED